MTDGIKGTGVALVTPFKEDRTVDFSALEKLLQHVADGGVDYLVVHGTTSESPTLTTKEKDETLLFIKSNNPGNLPVVLGMGSNNTAGLVERLQSLDPTGIDAILSVAPFYNKPGQSGLLTHFIEVADNSPVPVILYNVPSRTSSNLSAPTTLKLTAHPNIIGIKEASCDMGQCAEISASAPDGFMMISGDDTYTLPILSLGGSGVISVIANGLPRQFSDMVRAYLGGNHEKATEIFLPLVQISKLLFKEGNPTGIKELLSQLGITTNKVRLPLTEATSELQNEIKAALARL